MLSLRRAATVLLLRLAALLLGATSVLLETTAVLSLRRAATVLLLRLAALLLEATAVLLLRQVAAKSC